MLPGRGGHFGLHATPHASHTYRGHAYAQQKSWLCYKRDGSDELCVFLHFQDTRCAAKMMSMSLHCLKYGAWIQVCTGHGRSLLSSEQQFSKRVIIKAELRPKAGSSIFLSITVTPVCSIIKFLIKIIATTFILPSGWKKASSGSSNGAVNSTKTASGPFRSRILFSHFSYSSEKNGHNIASIF